MRTCRVRAIVSAALIAILALTGAKCGTGHTGKCDQTPNACQQGSAS